MASSSVLERHNKPTEIEGQNLDDGKDGDTHVTRTCKERLETYDFIASIIFAQPHI
jgi:hypothetical protein